MLKNRVKAEREKRGLKQYRLASRVRVHPCIISSIEHGLVPNKKLKRKLAKALDCEISDLFPEE